MAAWSGQGRIGRPATAQPLASIGPHLPGDIAFGTVEAAVLMHAEAGLLSLEALDLAEAATTGASVAALPVVAEAALEIRARIRHDRATSAPRPARDPAENRHPRLLRRPGGRGPRRRQPDTLHPFAERACLMAPLDPEVQLVYGCVAEALAEERSSATTSRRRPPGATRRPSHCWTRSPRRGPAGGAPPPRQPAHRSGR